MVTDICHLDINKIKHMPIVCLFQNSKSNASIEKVDPKFPYFICIVNNYFKNELYDFSYNNK